jgi:hypothetical protein
MHDDDDMAAPNAFRLPNAISTALQKTTGQNGMGVQTMVDAFIQNSFPFGPVKLDTFRDNFAKMMEAAQNGLPPTSHNDVFAYKDMISSMTAVVQSSTEARHGGTVVTIAHALNTHINVLTKELVTDRKENAKQYKWTPKTMADGQDTREYEQTFMKEMTENGVRNDNEMLRHLRNSLTDLPQEQKDAILNMIKAEKSLTENWEQIHSHYMAHNNAQAEKIRKQFSNLQIQHGESLPLFKMRAERMYERQFLKDGKLGTNEHVTKFHLMIKTLRSPVAQAAANQHHQANPGDRWGLDGLDWDKFWDLVTKTEATIGIDTTPVKVVVGDEASAGGVKKKRKTGETETDATARQGKRVADDSKKPCRTFAAGKCNYGDDCRWSHDPNMKVPEKSTSDCRNFKAGRCNYGDTCKYNHSAAAASI